MEKKPNDFNSLQDDLTLEDELERITS